MNRLVDVLPQIRELRAAVKEATSASETNMGQVALSKSTHRVLLAVANEVLTDIANAANGVTVHK